MLPLLQPQASYTNCQAALAHDHTGQALALSTCDGGKLTCCAAHAEDQALLAALEHRH